MGDLDFEMMFNEEEHHTEEAEDDGVGAIIVETRVQPKKATLEDFELKSLIGQGGYGKVYLVQRRGSGDVYALKILRKKFLIDTDNVEYTKAERDIMCMVHHPFIVSLHYAFQSMDRVYLVMDYMSGGPLFTHLRKECMFPEEAVRFYLAEIALAIDCLHRNDIIHRDLKPENILLNAEGHVAITDFGLSKILSGNEQAKTWVGTMEYLAPEIVTGQPYGKAVDWWALGILAFDMLTGAPPWQSTNEAKMVKMITTAKLKYPSYLSAEAQSLISKFLNRDPALRLGTNPSLSVREHPFFKKIAWRKLERGEISPPFRPPRATGLFDVQNFDTQLTSAEATVSPIKSHELPSRSQNVLFQGFSWQRESPTLPPSIVESSIGQLAPK